MPKIDITHTVALKNRPHPDAQLFRDLDTGEAEWDIPQDVSEPEPVAPPPVEPETEGTTGEPGFEPGVEPEPEKVTHEHKPKPKKLHHG